MHKAGGYKRKFGGGGGRGSSLLAKGRGIKDVREGDEEGDLEFVAEGDFLGGNLYVCSCVGVQGGSG